MFQVLQRYVANVYSKCFICFRRVLQVFYLDIAYIVVSIDKCSKRMLYTSRVYIAHEQGRQWAYGSGRRADVAHGPASTFVNGLYAHEMKADTNTTAVSHLRVSSRFVLSPRQLSDRHCS